MIKVKKNAIKYKDSNGSMQDSGMLCNLNVIGEDISDYCIQNEVTGTGMVTCDYVNENEHDIEVQLSSDTIEDFSSVTVTAKGKNFYSGGDVSGIQFKRINLKTPIPKGTYILSAKVDSEDTDMSTRLVLFYNASNAKVGQAMLQKGARNSVSVTLEEEVNNITFYASGSNDSGKDDAFSFTDIQIELGSYATPYEPYIEEVNYIADADGKLKGVKSIAPLTHLFCDTEGVNINAKYYLSPTADYDRFWDAYQYNGGREWYQYAFAGSGWRDDTFKPKYDIVPNGDNKADYMFINTEITNLKDLLDKSGVVLDVTRVTSLTQSFNKSQLTHVPPLDIRNVKTLNQTFYGCGKLQEITLLNFREDCVCTNTVGNCSSLATLNITGTINCEFGSSIAPLTNESVQNIIDCLADRTHTTAKSVWFSETTKSTMTEEQIAQITAKNWNLA